MCNGFCFSQILELDLCFTSYISCNLYGSFNANDKLFPDVAVCWIVKVLLGFQILMLLKCRRENGLIVKCMFSGMWVDIILTLQWKVVYRFFGNWECEGATLISAMNRHCLWECNFIVQSPQNVAFALKEQVNVLCLCRLIYYSTKTTGFFYTFKLFILEKQYHLTTESNVALKLLG